MTKFTIVAVFSIFGLLLFSHCNSGTTTNTPNGTRNTIEPKSCRHFTPNERNNICHNPEVKKKKLLKKTMEQLVWSY
jgi:hypothetical protein